MPTHSHGDEAAHSKGLSMEKMLALVALVLAPIAILAWSESRWLKREAYVRSFELPHGLFEQLRKKHPGLDLKQCQLVAQALRQFLLAHLMSRRKYVSMPSQAADDLWHEFILFTLDYEHFCKRAFGRFLHHTPAVAVTEGHKARAGLRRCWWFTCKLDNINPRKPTRLPLLFALDAKLGLAHGFVYTLDCEGTDAIVRREGDGATVVHCGSDLSAAGPFGDSPSGCGGGCGAGDAAGADGGCGGGGCGGCGGD